MHALRFESLRDLRWLLLIKRLLEILVLDGGLLFVELALKRNLKMALGLITGRGHQVAFIHHCLRLHLKLLFLRVSILDRDISRFLVEISLIRGCLLIHLKVDFTSILFISELRWSSHIVIEKRLRTLIISHLFRYTSRSLCKHLSNFF